MKTLADLPSDTPLLVIRGEWNEEDHPRDEGGKFTDGGGGGGDDEDEPYDPYGMHVSPDNDNPQAGPKGGNDNKPNKMAGRDYRPKGGHFGPRHGDNDDDPSPRGPTGGRRLKRAA